MDARIPALKKAVKGVVGAERADGGMAGQQCEGGGSLMSLEAP